MKKRLFAILLCASIFNWCDARFQDTDIQNSAQQQGLIVLHEAMDYAVVLPEKTLSILDDNLLRLNFLDENQKAEWYATRINASVRTSDLDVLKASIIAMLEFEQSKFYQHNKQTIINGLGVWFRRSGFLQQAKVAYQCNLQFLDNNSIKVTSLLNLAIVERNLGNLDTALELNHQALDLSKKLELGNSIASINNNLGVFALVSEDYDRAEKYFSTALNMNGKLMRRSGEILSGINLLHTFLRQNRPVMFERLYGRIQYMLERFPNRTRSAYLNLVSYANDYKQNKILLADVKPMIFGQYRIIEDKGIQHLLEPIMSELGISVDEFHQSESNYFNSSFQQLLSNCESPKNSLNS